MSSLKHFEEARIICSGDLYVVMLIAFCMRATNDDWRAGDMIENCIEMFDGRAPFDIDVLIYEFGGVHRC